MSTRGALGFRLNQTDKITYNHSDSYPSYLGEKVVHWCRSQTDWKEVKKKVRAMKKTSSKDVNGEKERLCNSLGLVGGERDWYWILRDTQGDLDKILEAKYYEDYSRFILDSLFCEYAYIINLDLMELEVYEGFQREPHDKGRYDGRISTSGYYPVALVGKFDLTNIPKNWREQCGFTD